MNTKWKEVTTKEDKEEGLKVYVHDETGDIRVKYPTDVPKWAQKVAMAIYKRGTPNERGIKDIVRGAWAYRINKAANDYIGGRR